MAPVVTWVEQKQPVWINTRNTHSRYILLIFIYLFIWGQLHGASWQIGVMTSLQEKSYHCEKPPSPGSLFSPPLHLSAFSLLLSTWGEISLRREGCDYAFKEQSQKWKKRTKERGGKMTKAAHCSGSPSTNTLQDVVQGLACLQVWGGVVQP